MKLPYGSKLFRLLGSLNMLGNDKSQGAGQQTKRECSYKVDKASKVLAVLKENYRIVIQRTYGGKTSKKTRCENGLQFRHKMV